MGKGAKNRATARSSPAHAFPHYLNAWDRLGRCRTRCVRYCSFVMDFSVTLNESETSFLFSVFAGIQASSPSGIKA